MKRQIILLSLICCLLSYAGVLAGQAEQPQQGVALTVYNANFAVVREARQIDFEQGVNRVRFTDVASAIDPTSVNFQCVSSPGVVTILEQNYQYDLINADSLLKRYIDREVNVSIRGTGSDTVRELTGVLLAALGPDLVLKSEKGDIEIIGKDIVEKTTLKQLPADLVTKPTLIWLADAKKAGSELCLVTYTTEQIGWVADYSAVLSPDETKIDFTGWVTVDNKSGATYRDATIKLIAGDVRKIAEVQPVYAMRKMAAEEAQGGGFEEKPFMEYHMYTLSRKSTVNNNEVKQIEFITPALGVSTKKLYIYDRSQYRDKIQIKLEFENTPENHLGIALPKGKVRVFKKDPADGMLEFVGEDKIDHTPKKEKLSLYIGNAFDVVPEYTLLDSKRGRRMTQETHKIELRNRKNEAITVFVDEKFPAGVNWTIDQATHKYEKRDAHTARFEVSLAADSTVTVQYTVTQTW